MSTDEMQFETTLADEIHGAHRIEIRNRHGALLRHLLPDEQARLAAALRAPEAADAGAVAFAVKYLRECEAHMLIGNLLPPGVVADRLERASPTAAGIAAPPAIESRCCREETSGAACGPFADLLRENEELQKRLDAAAPAASADAVRAADEAMKKIWSEWFKFYSSHFRGNVAISAADQMAFYEIAQPIIRAISAPVAGADAGMRERAAKVARDMGAGLDNEHNRALGVANDLRDTCEDIADAIESLPLSATIGAADGQV